MENGTIVIACANGCGKTTEDVNPHEFWEGKVLPSDVPEEMVPIWTCKECTQSKRDFRREYEELF